VVHLALDDPSGTFVATSGYGASGCAVIDPVEEPGARFAEEGTWAVCVTALQDQEVPKRCQSWVSQLKGCRGGSL
jgi:hypothetical protein